MPTKSDEMQLVHDLAQMDILNRVISLVNNLGNARSYLCRIQDEVLKIGREPEYHKEGLEKILDLSTKGIANSLWEREV